MRTNLETISGTVVATEKVIEKAQDKLPVGLRKTEPIARYTMERIKNFTCPACKEVLDEAISVNGKVRGWCGNSNLYVEESVR